MANPRAKFKTLRQEKGTQKKVAEDLGITETHLRELENGRSVPGTKMLIRIEHYLGASAKEIFPDIYRPEFFLK
ncbi:helix-turn-helix domain-containing protein [Paenibacillus glucanolyticus]|uniref:helix-turn-helix domain-containing protein n=1 Tax=Paenibacillus glucanolyticus TaxID=59843 RepID=UPI00128D0347|nr:helix-turn-helix transcriptional regulator [Paenibacillus glucanolyticus]MPY15822.1 helix-turn-helix transcriptional regulator [Paenibacillus glucanolyticus]